MEHRPRKQGFGGEEGRPENGDKKIKAAMDVMMVLMGGEGADGGGGGADGGGGGADEGRDNGMLLPSYSAGKFRTQCSEQRC
jgi:hypothetical protein